MVDHLTLVKTLRDATLDATGKPLDPGEFASLPVESALQAANEIVLLWLELAEARRALELSRSNAVFYKDGVLIAAFDQYGKQIFAHKVVTL